MEELTVKATSGRASPQQAIKAFCFECCGYDREMALTCPTRVCPLWPYVARKMVA